MLDLVSWHPTTPETDAKWHDLGVRPLLTVDVGGLRHTISLDMAFRSEHTTAFDSDTGNRVYVIGHNFSDALDIALATPVYRPPYQAFPWSTPEVNDPDDDEIHEPASFGLRYLATAEQIEEDVDGETLHLRDDGKWYDLGSGYGPTWTYNAVPPIEACAGLIAHMTHDGAFHHGHITITDYGDHSLLVVGWLEVKAPPLRLGIGAESIRTLVARLTHDVYELTFAEQNPGAFLGYNAGGFWAWFTRVALSAGLRALQVSEREGDTLYLLLDSRCCSGSDGCKYGPLAEPQVP